MNFQKISTLPRAYIKMALLLFGVILFVSIFNIYVRNEAPAKLQATAASLLEEGCSAEGSNAGFTACAEKILNRVSAEREWKQRKLETIKHPEINKYDLSPVLEIEHKTIREWRENFKNMRDQWCVAVNTFVYGSSTDRNIIECQIELELSAIDDLNHLYYERIMKYVYGSEGIKDFELLKDR